MALVASGVSYSYTTGRASVLQAVRSVDITVRMGDLVLVAGTTGSGKSTLLRMLAGLLVPSQGSVEADGLSPASPSARGRVALVFQDPETQFFAETLRADVAFGPRNMGRTNPDDAAERALRAVGLDPAVYGPRSPFTLSGGEARRGAIAGALALGAPYLLLDEPTAGLDARGRTAVQQMIDAERSRSGIVVVSHDPSEFLDTASAIVALDDGGVAFTGSPQELYTAPDAYLSAGLPLPSVVQTQILARARGGALKAITTDPARAAESLLALREALR